MLASADQLAQGLCVADRIERLYRRAAGTELAPSTAMTWLTALALAVVIVAIAALFGLQPRGGRNASGTRLMSVGRAVLVIAAVIVAWLIFRGA